jgi:hypothetical protein
MEPNGRKQPQVERFLPLGVGSADDVGAFAEADVVHEDVEPAEGFDGAQNDVGDALVGGDVGLNREHPLAAAGDGADRGDGGCQPFLAAGTDGDAAAFLDKRPRDREPESLRGPGHDRDLVFDL